MPAMNDLLVRLQDNPPETEMDLRAILDETGYDLIMKEPMLEEAPVDDSVEFAEDAGPEEVPEDGEVVEVEGETEDPMALMEQLMPPGMGKPHANEHPRMKVRRMTMVAAHNAMPKDEEGRE